MYQGLLWRLGIQGANVQGVAIVSIELIWGIGCAVWERFQEELGSFQVLIYELLHVVLRKTYDPML